MLCDVEPFLVDWKAPADDIRANAAALKRMLQPIQLRLCTNSRRYDSQRDLPCLTTRAHKPFTSLGRLHGTAGDVTIIGDLLVIDGLLAFRLNGTFLWFRQQGKEIPAWPRLLALVDGLVFRLLLKRLELQ